ncbi:MAG: outer membrane protein [Rhodomicrobium sp.]|nr:MAG: outer membrane protein [Rhodomicrobium sp.]
MPHLYLTSSLKNMSKLIAIGLASALLMVSAPLQAKTYDAEEKAAIKDVVKEYLLENPGIIREALEELERRTAEEERNRQQKLISENKDLLVNPEYSHVAGNKDGDVTVIEFFDYNCPYCRQSLKDIVKLMENDKNVKIVLKEYPILGEASKVASLAALASRKQGKYMEYHTALLSAKGRINKSSIISIAKKVGLDIDQLEKDMVSKEVENELQKNIDVGIKLGINGTPTFIFNDRVVPQVLPYEAMQQVIAKLRKAS